MQITKPRTHDIEDHDLRRFHEDLYKIFQRRISFGTTVDNKDQNIDGKMVDIADTGINNVEFSVTHNLGRVPLYFDIKYRNIAVNIFDSGTPWTTTKAFFKATLDHAHVRLFIH